MGTEPNESFAIKLDCFQPSLVIIAYYGITEGQFKHHEILKIQSEVFNMFENYSSEGSDVLILGDFNNHLGQNLGLDKNNAKESVGGKNLIRWITQNDLFLLNTLDQSHTHADLS